MTKQIKRWFSRGAQSANPSVSVSDPVAKYPKDDTHTATWENNVLGTTRCIGAATQQWSQETDFTDLSPELVYGNSLLVNRHAGCWGYLGAEETWSSTTHPDTSGETLNGWTFTLSGSSTSSVAFETGQLKPTFKSENSASKTSSYFRNTSSTITADYYLEAGLNFKRTAVSGNRCLLWGFFASDTFNVNSMFFHFDSNGKPYFVVYDDLGNEYSDSGSNGDLSENTPYWVRIFLDYFNVNLYVYDNEDDFYSWNTPSVELYLDLSGMTGDLSLTKFGWLNAAELTTCSETWNIVKTDGYNCAYFYSDGTAKTTDISSDELFYVDYSKVLSVYYDNPWAEITFKRRRQLTQGGAFTIDGTWSTLAEIQAMSDEQLYGFGIEISMTASEYPPYLSSITAYFYYSGETKTWSDTADFSNVDVEIWCNNSLQSFHAGCWNGESWDADHFPTLTEQTLNGWSLNTISSPTYTVDFDAGKLELSFTSESDAAKRVRYQRSINNTWTYKDTVFECGLQYQRTAVSTTGAICWGFFNYGQDYDNSSIHFFVDGNGKPILRVYDSAGTLVSNEGSNGDLSESTDYFPKLANDGTNITCKIYPTYSDYVADTNVIRTLTISVASITGSFQCDRFGFHNYNEASVTSSSTWLVTKVTSNVSNMYNTGYANCVDVTESGNLFNVNYASFAATVSGSVSFRRRRKLTVNGIYTLDDRYYTVAQIQALGNENLFGFGLIAKLVATTTLASVDAIGIDTQVALSDSTYVTFKEAADTYYL